MVRFSIKASDNLMSDPNPIINERSSTSTAGLSSISALCDFLWMKLNLDEPRAVYHRGWEPNAAKFIASWSLSIQDLNNLAVTLTFDFMDDNLPITMGMDLERFSITDNTSEFKKLL